MSRVGNGGTVVTALTNDQSSNGLAAQSDGSVAGGAVTTNGG